MKRSIAVVLILLVLLAAGIGFSGWLRPGSEPVPPAPPPEAGPGPDAVPVEPVVKDGPATPGSTDDTSAAPGTEPAAKVAPGAGPAIQKPAEPGASAVGPDSADGEDRPAIRRNPRDPPPPDPKSRPLGKRPPFGPTGLWEKFPPAIPRGRATLTVRIVGKDGLPLPGAEVWLGPPDIRGEAAVSYAHLRKLGRADDRGRVTASKLPSGRAAVAGNLTGLLNGPRGLDARTAIAVTLVDDETVRADLVLPFSASSFGRVTGVVRGPGGDPLRNAQVFVGYFRVRTDKAGAFEIPYLPAGDHTLSISRSGYRAHGESVTVETGETAEVDVTLTFREAGSITLGGTVTGPAGEPVPDATVYVIAYGVGSAGTIRSARTDEQGRYLMESLPDRLAKVKVRLQASRMGYHAANEVLEKGLRSGEVDLRLPVKLSKLRLTVLDAVTRDPLTRCRFEARRDGETRSSATFSSRSETGEYEKWIQAGKYTFLIEAPDHESQSVEVTIPDGGADFVYTARLVGERDQALEVALTVVVVSAVSGQPIDVATVEVLDPGTGNAVARLEGRRPGGRFTLPAPSGRRRIRVTASGYEVYEQEIDLKPDEAEREIEARLAPE